MKYVLMVIGFLTLVVFLMFYGVWAWSHVIDWYFVNYLSKYFEWAKNVPIKAVQVSFLFGAIIYSIWWGSKELTKSNKEKTTEENVTDIITFTLSALCLPWVMQFVLWLQVSWFNL